jgi:hypothetical protein
MKSTIKTIFSILKFDTFVGGLVIGAILSLLVNVATVQLQEMITRQKNLEALEHEIMGHFTNSATIIETYADELKTGTPTNPYSFSQRYPTTVWDSGEILNHIYSLPSQTQSKISLYYSYVVSTQNRKLDRLENDVNQLEFAYMSCLFKKELDCPKFKQDLDAGVAFYMQQKFTTAGLMANESNTVLDVFHPTDDRLKNPVLKLFMGDNAIPILKTATPSAK